MNLTKTFFKTSIAQAEIHTTSVSGNNALISSITTNGCVSLIQYSAKTERTLRMCVWAGRRRIMDRIMDSIMDRIIYFRRSIRRIN